MFGEPINEDDVELKAAVVAAVVETNPEIDVDPSVVGGGVLIRRPSFPIATRSWRWKAGMWKEDTPVDVDAIVLVVATGSTSEEKSEAPAWAVWVKFKGLEIFDLSRAAALEECEKDGSLLYSTPAPVWGP